MALDRNSATACLLVLVACVLALSAPSPSERREQLSASAIREDGPRRPAKASYRIYFRDEASALEWLRGFAEVLAKGESAASDPETLAKACADLSAESIEGLLKDQTLWAQPTVTTQEAWLRSLRLLPLRRALVERFALVDLPRGLRAYPTEASILLCTAARRDGAMALQDWLAFREEWRANPDLAFPSLGQPDTIESLVLGPDRRGAEIQVVAALMEGWASSDPEAAWTTLAERSGWTTGATVRGLMAGLKPGSDWKRWTERLEAIDWQKAEYGSATPHADPYLTLAGNWIREDPDLAVAWYRRWQNHSANTPNSPPIMFPTASRADSFWPAKLDGEVFLLSGWIGEQESEALKWLEKNGAEDRLLGQIVAASTLGEAPKMKVLDMIEDAEIRGHVAIKIANDSASPAGFAWTLATDQGKDRDFVERMNSLYALGDLEDDARERLAEITVKRLKLDE